MRGGGGKQRLVAEEGDAGFVFEGNYGVLAQIKCSERLWYIKAKGHKVGIDVMTFP